MGAQIGGTTICVHKPTSCNHVVTIPERGWALRDCERRRSDGDPGEPSSGAEARARGARHGGMTATSGSRPMQPFAGPGRRERSGSGRRPHGSVSDPRSEREPGGDIPGGDSPQGDRARGPLAGPRAPRRRRGNRCPLDGAGPSALGWHREKSPGPGSMPGPGDARPRAAWRAAGPAFGSAPAGPAALSRLPHLAHGRGLEVLVALDDVVALGAVQRLEVSDVEVAPLV